MDRHSATLGPAASFEQGMLTVLRSMMNGNMPTLASLRMRCQRLRVSRGNPRGSAREVAARRVIHVHTLQVRAQHPQL